MSQLQPFEDSRDADVAHGENEFDSPVLEGETYIWLDITSSCLKGSTLLCFPLPFIVHVYSKYQWSPIEIWLWINIRIKCL